MIRPSPAQLRQLRKADPRLGEVLARLGPYPGFPERGRARRESHFDVLVSAIVGQQLAGAAARAIASRLVALTPGPRYPPPELLRTMPKRQLRGVGLSGAKADALRDLSAHVDDGRLHLPSLGRLPDEAIIERLIAVRGIGPWTVQMFLMFRLGRLDVMPATDLGIREGLRRLDGLDERPAPAEVVERARVWAPLRTVAAWTLWRLTDGDAEL